VADLVFSFFSHFGKGKLRRFVDKKRIVAKPGFAARGFGNAAGAAFLDQVGFTVREKNGNGAPEQSPSLFGREPPQLFQKQPVVRRIIGIGTGKTRRV